MRCSEKREQKDQRTKVKNFETKNEDYFEKFFENEIV